MARVACDVASVFRQPIELDYYFSPDGLRYAFDNGRDILLMSFDGLGMPGIDYITEQGPFQHGQTLLDYRLQPRIIQMMHRRVAPDRQGYWENRADAINLLRPNRQLSGSFGMGKLRKVMPGNITRDIDVIVQQGPLFSAHQQDVLDEYEWTETIRFIAGDPTFYDPDQVVTTWVVSELGGLYFYSVAYPDDLFFPVSFGTDVINASASIHYTGTWHAFPTIYITGPINQPVVQNSATGEKIQIAYNVSTGEVVTISLPFGSKSVTNNVGTNLIGTVTSDSDLATFHIAPEPEAAWCGTHPRPCGLNTFSVSGGGGVVGLTQISMTYNTRFIGI